jgi:ABC-type phosphate transport system substrate-binding protein
MTKYGLPIAMLFLLSVGCAHAQCVPGGLAVVVNKANPVESLSMSQLRKLILGDVRNWPNNKTVALIARDPSTQVFQCALSGIVRLSVAEYHRYVISAEFRGDDPMAIQTVDSDAAALRSVGNSPGGLAVIQASSAATAAGSVKVVRVEGKGLGQPGYPL